MKIQKKEINGYNVFIHKTKKYTTITMRFLFEIPYTKEDIFKCDLLEEYMLHSLEKYKTRKEIGNRCMELYNMHFSIDNYNKGVKMFTVVTFDFYDPVLIKDDYLKDAFEFAKEILFHPNFEDGKLDKEELTRSKDYLVSRMGDMMLDPDTKARENFVNAIYPDTYMTIDIVSSKDEYKRLLDSFTDEDLIEMYDRLIGHSLVGLVIMGNIKDEYLDYIEELFKFKSVATLDEDYQEVLKINTDTPYFIKMSDPECKESILRCVYTCPKGSYKKRFTYNIIARMLGYTGMLLHQILRDELQLVYRVTLSYNDIQGRMIFFAFLDRENVDRALEGFDEALKRLENEDLMRELLNKIKEENDLALYTFDESKRNIFFELYDEAFNFDISLKKKCNIMAKITEKDIMKALKDLKRVKIHLYEGMRE